MQINDVTISLVLPQNGLIAFASIVLQGGFYVTGIAIHEKLDRTGYRLTYPTRRTANQSFTICHPINYQASKAIEQAIFENLKTVLNKGCKNAGHNSDQSASR